MSHGGGLHQVLVEAQSPGDGPADLADFQRMGQPGAVVVPLRGEKDLGLVLEPPKGLGMDDPVPVPLVLGTDGTGLCRKLPAPALGAQ